MKIYNKGKRSYTAPLKRDKETLKCLESVEIIPGRTVEIADALGKKLIAAYPRDLMDAEKVVETDQKGKGKGKGKNKKNQTPPEDNGGEDKGGEDKE